MDLVDAPALAPGSCAVSKSDVGPFVDTGIDFDTLPSYGRLYLCSATVETMAQLLGWVPGEKIRRIRSENRRLREELAAKDQALEAAHSAIAALKGAGYTEKEPARGAA